MQNKPVLEDTITATAAITKRRCVGYDGALSGAGEYIFGVATATQASGDATSCVTMGTAQVEAGGAIAAGARVATAADGKVVAHSSGIAVGFAKTAAGADGDIIEVKLDQMPA